MPKLSSLAVQRRSTPGLICDGDGLYLRIKAGGSKSWIFRYNYSGRARSMGLGSLSLVSLAEARLLALECRKLLLRGQDPILVRKDELSKRAAAGAKAITFDQCAAQYIESQKPSWKNAKHAQQWTNTLKTYASPVFGNLPVQMVDTLMIMKVLEPIWSTKTETASRVRSRVELVLAWAAVRGYRSGDNPAVWRNHLDKLLARPSRVQKVKHFAALPYEEIGEFIQELRERSGTAARALEFVILTAARTSEVLNAQWSEINFPEKLWIIPAARMKAGLEHRVPLSSHALDILRSMKERSENEFVFPGDRKGRPLSNVALLKVLERMNVDVTTHGFRSSFRDWAAERTNFSREVCEQALAHTLKDKVEASYRRGDLLLKRRLLMEEWCTFCSIPKRGSAVIALSQIQQLSGH